jgi:hypothetical protein
MMRNNVSQIGRLSTADLSPEAGTTSNRLTFGVDLG